MRHWWIAVSLGRLQISLWGDGRVDYWRTRDDRRGVFGVLIGREES